MEDIIKHIKNKNYKIIEITKSINVNNMKIYEKSIQVTKSKIILFFKKNRETEELFKLKKMDNANYWFLGKGGFLILTITDIFTKCHQITLNNFINSEFDCLICYDDKNISHTCKNCGYRICLVCMNKLKINSNIKNNIFCPHCQQIFYQ